MKSGFGLPHADPTFVESPSLNDKGLFRFLMPQISG